MNPDNKTVLIAINDVFFYAKLRDALKPQGYTLERARTQAEVKEKAGSLQPAAFIINMNDDKLDALKAVEEIKTVEGLQSLPVLAFANHEEVDTFRRAKQLGITKIVSRNEFSARTRDLVEEVLGTQPSAVSPQPKT